MRQAAKLLANIITFYATAGKDIEKYSRNVIIRLSFLPKPLKRWVSLRLFMVAKVVSRLLPGS